MYFLHSQQPVAYVRYSETFSDEDEGDSDDSEGDLGLSDTDMDEDEETTQEPVRPQRELTQEQRAARQAAMDKLVPEIDPSEYGKMPPSFHSNSQRVAPVTLETELRDEISSDSAANPPSKSESSSRPIRPPILPRDRYDGVDSDDETDEEDAAGDEEDEEDHPQVVGEVEIDMAEEEDEFIEFARQALGVSDEQWHAILSERRDRGGMCLM